MSMTMLQIVQAAAGEMGLAVPTYVAGNTQQDVVQLLALLNSVGRDLQQEYEWQKLIVEYLFTTQYTQTTGDVANNSAIITNIPDTTGLDTTYQVIGEGIQQSCYIVSVDSPTQITMNQAANASALTTPLNFCKMKYTWPENYDRQVDRTQWDKTKHWEMLGPETSQEWQWLKSGYISTGPRLRWRQLDGLFQIWPAVTSNETLSLEYVSTTWARSANGTPKLQLDTDTDKTIYTDQMMIAGLKAEYFGVKGFDSTKFEGIFNRLLNIAKASDKEGRTLSFAPTISNVLITPENIPDSGFGQPFQ